MDHCLLNCPVLILRQVLGDFQIAKKTTMLTVGKDFSCRRGYHISNCGCALLPLVIVQDSRQHSVTNKHMARFWWY